MSRCLIEWLCNYFYFQRIEPRKLGKYFHELELNIEFHEVKTPPALKQLYLVSTYLVGSFCMWAKYTHAVPKPLPIYTNFNQMLGFTTINTLSNLRLLEF